MDCPNDLLRDNYCTIRGLDQIYRPSTALCIALSSTLYNTLGEPSRKIRGPHMAAMFGDHRCINGNNS